MATSPSFPDELDARDAGSVNGSTRFKLIAPFRYISPFGTVTVPKGFITDGASVPRVFWSIFPPFGPYFKAAVIHDYLYWAHSAHANRGEADKIFLLAMKDLGVPFLTRRTVYRAVRTFGWAAYKKVRP